jgi:hypothetical protein
MIAPVKNISDLSFTGIKTSLKNFLKNQSELSDFDFEGSTMNILLDVLSYNTQFQSFYTNMIANEMFMDSATLRSSIVSAAKLIGYIPSSARCSRAKINIQFNGIPDTVSQILIPKNTAFLSSKDNISYRFYTKQDYTALRNNNFLINDIEIIEGTVLTFKYTVSEQQLYYEIPNDNVDISTLTVTVFDSQDSLNPTIYQKVVTSENLNPDSKIYFIEENTRGKYEVVFGDNIIGNNPPIGSIVQFDYIVSNLNNPNNISIFTLTSSISGYSNITITTSEKSNGGSEKESKTKIQRIAPKTFQTQNRAITTEDYRNLLLRDYANINDAKVWGGEDAVPKQYGKVFIALLPKENFIITDSIKENIIKTILKPANVTTVIPEIVNSEIFYIIPEIKLYYDKNKTTLSSNAIVNNVKQKIIQFSNENLERFDKKFLYSTLVNIIDKSDNSIVSNETSLKCKLIINTTPNILNRYILNFNNQLQVNSVVSSPFLIAGVNNYIDDDGLGNLRLYEIVSNQKLYKDNTFGTINYSSGLITIPELSTTSTQISITTSPQNKNIIGVREQVLTIINNDINILIFEEKING